MCSAPLVRASLSARSRQTATLVADAAGLLIYTIDAARSVQGCVHLKRDAFRSWSVSLRPGEHKAAFELGLHSLVDSVAVFAASDGAGNPRKALPSFV